MIISWELRNLINGLEVLGSRLIRCRASGFVQCLLFRSRNKRHSFAIHLLENGTNIVNIKRLLEHSSISSTLRYTRISKQRVSSTISPLDRLYRWLSLMYYLTLSRANNENHTLKPMLEIADIFQCYGENYQRHYVVSYEQKKAIHAILHCRTAILGGPYRTVRKLRRH